VLVQPANVRSTTRSGSVRPAAIMQAGQTVRAARCSSVAERGGPAIIDGKLISLIRFFRMDYLGRARFGECQTPDSL
jgi:hypothetical protein